MLSALLKSRRVDWMESAVVLMVEGVNWMSNMVARRGLP